MSMVNFVLMEEVEEIIPKVKRTLGSDYFGSYGKEIILEGLQADTSRINRRPMRVEDIPIPCMPLWMEISLDGSFETLRMETIEGKQKHETLKEENKEFHDAQEVKEQNKAQELELSKTQ